MELLQNDKCLWPIYEKIVRLAMIEFCVRDGKIYIDSCPERDFEAGQYIRHAWNVCGESGLLGLLVAARFWMNGPKVFRPSDEECRILDHIDPHITLVDYVQPFPTMMIEFPAEYRQELSITREDTASGKLSKAFPLALLIHHESTISVILSITRWSDHCDFTNRFHTSNSQTTLADLLRKKPVELVRSLPVSEREADLNDRVVCLAVNAMLLLAGYGCRRLGRDNPAHVARLEKYLRNAQKHNKDVDKARAELRALPVVYSFSQEVQLCKYHPSLASSRGEPTGKKVSPHWRRGYMRMQPYGPGRALRRLKFIRPVMVNRNRFGGSDSDTSATYEE